MIRVARQPPSQNLGVDLGAAGFGMLLRLQERHHCTFAIDETISVQVEGPAGMLRVIVARRQCPHTSPVTQMPTSL